MKNSDFAPSPSPWFLLSLKTKMSITCEFFLQFSKLKIQQQKTASTEKNNLPVIEVGFVTCMDVLSVLALMREIKNVRYSSVALEWIGFCWGWLLSCSVTSWLGRFKELFRDRKWQNVMKKTMIVVFRFKTWHWNLTDKSLNSFVLKLLKFWIEFELILIWSWHWIDFELEQSLILN